MKSIPNINLTERDVDGILIRNLFEGGEAYICKSENPHSIYKLFRNIEQEESEENLNETFYIPSSKSIIDMPENKLRKIEQLYQMQLEHSVKPLSTISMNGRLIGYEMTRDPEDRTLSPGDMYRSELIHCLESTKTILEYFATKDIIYGDVAPRNILINKKTGKAKFCDIDNMRVGQYPIDTKGYCLTHFTTHHGKEMNATADAYMHNLLTMKKLHFTSAYESDIIKALNRGIYPTKFKKTARPIFESMANPANFTGEYIIQYVKR